ncbi:MAG TPA: hypothetical protein VLZ05_14955 [Mycobacterium sp.]|nr:hypothetical protein [Mycobacterium sp.]HUH70032.1 hypothetical protein [Mycobacterium sp.]
MSTTAKALRGHFEDVVAAALAGAEPNATLVTRCPSCGARVGPVPAGELRCPRRRAAP